MASRANCPTSTPKSCSLTCRKTPVPQLTEQDFKDALATVARMFARAVTERDDAAQAFSQAYYLVTGNSPKWSETFGYTEALEDIKDACILLRASIMKQRTAPSAE